MKLKPNKFNLEFLSWEMGVFFHFGIRSFHIGHRDWDGKPLDPAKFDPKQFDCKQWVRIAKKAGAKYCILTCNHHDGFCNWPSKYSEFTVAKAPWQNGKGDVVAEFVNACREYNMKIGLYYSPAQWGGDAHYDDPVKYDEYFINQITELLTNYGKIDYLWFDGCGSENHKYDQKRIIEVIRTLQPEIGIFNMWDPDTRWVGNEDGYADMPNVNVVIVDAFSMLSTEKKQYDRERYMAAECDTRIRNTWFDCEYNPDMIKSIDELMGMYDLSVGRSANLLINIGPDSRGLLPEEDAKRMLEFGEEIRRRYTYALDFSEPKLVGENKWRIEDPEVQTKFNRNWIGTQLVDTVIIEEDITDGDAIEEFRIIMKCPMHAPDICIYRGCTVGHKHIAHFPTVRTGALTLEVTKADGEVKIKSMKAYYTKK